MVKEYQTIENQQNNTSNNVKKGIGHSLFPAAFNDNDIADDENNTDDNISEKQIVHIFGEGKTLSPIKKQATASNKPIVNDKRSNLLPVLPGIKIPTNAEPTKSLDMSIKYSDIFSSWPFDNFINDYPQINYSVDLMKKQNDNGLIVDNFVVPIADLLCYNQLTADS